MSKYRKAHNTDIYAYIISAYTYKHMAGIKKFFKKSKKLFAKSCCKYHTKILFAITAVAKSRRYVILYSAALLSRAQRANLNAARGRYYGFAHDAFLYGGKSFAAQRRQNAGDNG